MHLAPPFRVFLWLRLRLECDFVEKIFKLSIVLLKYSESYLVLFGLAQKSGLKILQLVSLEVLKSLNFKLKMTDLVTELGVGFVEIANLVDERVAHLDHLSLVRGCFGCVEVRGVGVISRAQR